MTCPACEAAVEGALKKIPGIERVYASFVKGKVEYIETPDQLNHNGSVEPALIIAAIEGQGYKVVLPEGGAAGLAGDPPKSESKTFSGSEFIGIVIIVLALLVIVKNTVGFNNVPEISGAMGYFALFLVGLVTSLHCVAMCGGINISQCMNVPGDAGAARKALPSLLYNSGRVVSYTVIGGLAGALGASVSFSGPMKGIVAILTGIFMIIMGLNLFGIFPWIRRITPRLPSFLSTKKSAMSAGKGPFLVGLLNGLMPCGPLQAMQLYALGTGSFLVGAFSMFFFSLGTIPLMLGLGFFSSLMGAKSSRRMLRFGAVLVMALGLVMFGRGLALSGVALPIPGMGAGVALSTTGGNGTGAVVAVNQAVMTDGVQVIETELTSNGYPEITVTKGIPVKWNLKAEAVDINGCNETLIIPEYNVEKKLEPGDNIITFTPTESGVIPYSCWMGMIQSRINVVEKAGDATSPSAQPTSQIPQVVVPQSGGCCGGANGVTEGSGGIGGN